MENYYFTFGSIHKHPIMNFPMNDYWIKITAPSHEIARTCMSKLFGPKWAFCYSEDNFDTSDDRDFFPKGEYLHVTCNDTSFDLDQLQQYKSTQNG